MVERDTHACILKTKLYAPRLHEVIYRKNLFRKLAAARTAKLTTVVAGAGYGKSTLASSFLASHGRPSIWYQLEETDRDLYQFISYLLAGIRMKWGDFGEETIGRLQAVDDMSSEGDTVIFTLISEIDEHIKDDFLIVLDDFQNVNESPTITGALNLFINHMPHNFHLMVLTRARPNLDLPHLAAGRELVEINEHDLRFMPDETTELFSKLFSLRINTDEAEELCEYTEGWVTGLVLCCLVAKERGEEFLMKAVHDLEVPPSRIGEYLSEVIFENQGDLVRGFIEKTALLSRMNPVFCDKLLDIDDSGTVLEYLVNSRIFTITQDAVGEWYRYHHLLRSFAIERLGRNYSREEINRLHLKAASLWDEWGDPEQALHHYMEAGDFENAGKILDCAAPDFMDSSRISFLRENVMRIPEEIIWKHRWLIHQFAEQSHLQGDFELALRASEHAAKLFEESGDTDAMLNSMIRTGMAMFELGRIDEYEKTISELLDNVQIGTTLWYSLSAVLGKYSIVEGKYELADRFTANALDNIHKIEDKTLRSNLLFSSGMVMFHTGDYVKSYGMINEAFELAESVGNTTFAMNMICVLSPSAITLGRYEEALRLAEKGLAMQERISGDTPFTYLYLVSKATVLMMMGNREGAMEVTEEAFRVSKKCGYGAEVMYAHYFMAGMRMYFGDKDQALYHFGIAKRIAREIPFVIVEHMARLGEIQLCYREMGISAAVAETRTIASSVNANFNDTFSMHPFIILAYLEEVAGHTDRARKALAVAVEMAGNSQSFGLWKWATSDNDEVAKTLLPLIAEMFSRGEKLDSLSGVLRHIGKRSIPFLSGLSRSGNAVIKEKARELLSVIKSESMQPLCIKTLGTFEVVRGGERIRPRDWKSRKALAIMKYLAAQDDTVCVSREVLMELLWPGGTPESASKNLGVALSYLRKILEPDAIRGESSYLITDGDTLGLELGRGGSVDFKLFREKVKEAVDAEEAGDENLYLEKLRQAEGLFRGEFMAEDIYEDWCLPEREQLHGEYLELLLKISNEFRRRGALDEAFCYLDKAVKSNPDWEDLYRSEMEICAALGNRPGIERAYNNCCEYLKKNYDLSPSPETVEVYQKLRGN